MNPAYEGVGQELARRIEALIPEHPEVLTMADPWALFKVPGFKCDDLQPSVGQAAAALRLAQQRHRTS